MPKHAAPPKTAEQWLRVSITADAVMADNIAAFLSNLTGGSEQIPAADEPNARETIVSYSKTTPQTPQELQEIEEFLARLSSFFPTADRPAMTTETIQDQDWNQAWKERFKPFSITPHLVIKPSWEAYSPESGQKIIEMDPGMAFGTGHHASTRLALLFIEQMFYAGGIRPASILDVGTGTGILAMAAALFGAEKTLAIDNDPEAVAVACENVLRNGLQELVTVSGADLAGIQEKFDLIIANIIHDTLLEIAADLHALLAPGGRLILAGILAGEQSEDIRAAYEELGLLHQKTTTEGEWSSLLFRKP